MEKRHISAHAVVQDIHAGMDDIALMTNYNLSAKDFKALCGKLVETGRLTEVELSELELLWSQKEGRVWHCPACHMPQSHEFEECPQCGILVAKYERLHPKEVLPPQNDEFIEVPADAPEENIPDSTVRPVPDEQTPASRCPACSTLLSEGAKFCQSCGAPIRN
ncbi:MAG: zinc-ribbon domain-containing protein [Desulfomonilaceae bacterium]